MTDDSLQAMMDEADHSGNGTLDIQEFTFLITQVLINKCRQHDTRLACALKSNKNMLEHARAGRQAALDQESSTLPAHLKDLLKCALQQLKPIHNSAYAIESKQKVRT